jgi:hypothetical protein
MLEKSYTTELHPQLCPNVLSPSPLGSLHCWMSHTPGTTIYILITKKQLAGAPQSGCYFSFWPGEVPFFSPLVGLLLPLQSWESWVRPPPCLCSSHFSSLQRPSLLSQLIPWPSSLIPNPTSSLLWEPNEAIPANYSFSSLLLFLMPTFLT